MACNCNDQYQHPCAQTPCITPQDCACPTILKTDCSVYNGDDLPVTGIKKNTIETNMWQQLDAYLGKLKTDLLGGMNLVNLGTIGARIYKGIDLLGRKEIRRLIKIGNLVTVTENTDDISVGIDEGALSTFITASTPTQKTYSATNVGTGVGVLKDTTTLLNNTQFNFRKITKKDLGLGASVIASVQESILGTEIEIGVKKIKTDNLLITDTPLDILINQKPIITNNLLITENTTNVLINQKDIISDTLIITNNATQIKIDTLQASAIPALYVNNTYLPTYREWFLEGGNINLNYIYKGMGTLAKPFIDGIRFTSETTSVRVVNTAIQNALNSYVGIGGRGLTFNSTLPEKLGQQIIIQSFSQGYLFEGDFNYFGINIKLEEGVYVTHSPSISDWLFDFDLFGDNVYFYSQFIIEKNSRLVIQKNGFRNRGSNFIGSGYINSKTISILGDGLILQSHISLADSTIYTVIESNFLNLSGFVNDANATFNVKNISISTLTQTLVKAGSALTGGLSNGEGRILDFKNVLFNYSSIGQNTPTTARPIKIAGTCYIRFENCNFYIFSNQIIDSLFELNHNCILNLNSPLFNGTISNLFYSQSMTQKPNLICINSRVIDGIYLGGEIGTPNRFIFATNLSTGKWDTIYFNNNFINRGLIDYQKIDLINNSTGTINFIGNEGFARQVVLNLPFMTPSNAAISLSKNAAYINSSTGALSVVPI